MSCIPHAELMHECLDIIVQKGNVNFSCLLHVHCCALVLNSDCKLLSVHLILSPLLYLLCVTVVLNSACKLLSVHLILLTITLFLPVVCSLLCTGAEFSLYVTLSPFDIINHYSFLTCCVFTVVHWC